MLGVALSYGSMDKGYVLSQFWKLGFCQVRECENFSHRGQLCKFHNCEHVARFPIWNLPKTCFHDPPKPRFDAQLEFYDLGRDSTRVSESLQVVGFNMP